VGQSILADFDNSLPADQFSEEAFRIESPVPLGGGNFNDVSLLRIRVELSSSDYQIIDGTGTYDSKIPITSGLHIQFTLTAPSSYSLALTPLVSGATTDFFSGALPVPPVTIPPTPPYPATQISFFNASSSIGGAPMYLNNIAVTPEPASLAVVACAVCFLLRRRTSSR
jgi:hypothetical protein